MTYSGKFMPACRRRAAEEEVEAEACGTCHVIGPLQASQRALLDLFPESDFDWFCQQLIGLVEEVL